MIKEFMPKSNAQFSMLKPTSPTM